MLRNPPSSRVLVIGLLLMAAVGGLAALLVWKGNPGNMGICGACFLRDEAGALGLLGKGAPGAPAPPAHVRPELVGLVLGALALGLARRRHARSGGHGARSGGHAATRLVAGVFMAIAALVFLGCPFRMLQRLGGGDVNAWFGLAGFVPGVLVGLAFERKGYGAGSTSPAPVGVGLHAPVVFAGLLALAGAGVLVGPGLGAGAPAHAPWTLALGVGLVAGAILSATGFCAVSAARQVVARPKAQLLGAAALVLGYAAVALATGIFRWGSAGQPIAHADGLWNALAMSLVGFTGVLAGGCPVRQVVMAGEGNGDAFVTVLGILLGGAIAHGLGLVSSPATGPTAFGKVAVGIGWAYGLAYATSVVLGKRPTAPQASAAPQASPAPQAGAAPQA